MHRMQLSPMRVSALRITRSTIPMRVSILRNTCSTSSAVDFVHVRLSAPMVGTIASHWTPTLHPFTPMVHLACNTCTLHPLMRDLAACVHALAHVQRSRPKIRVGSAFQCTLPAPMRQTAGAGWYTALPSTPIVVGAPGVAPLLQGTNATGLAGRKMGVRICGAGGGGC